METGKTVRRVRWDRDFTCTVVQKHEFEKHEIFTCRQMVGLLESNEDGAAEKPLVRRVGKTHPHSAIEEGAAQASLNSTLWSAPRLRELGERCFSMEAL